MKAHPGRTQELLEYMHLIRTAASRALVGGQNDQQFRARMQESPKRSWAMVDSEPWALYMTPSPFTGSNYTTGIRPRGFSKDA